MKTINRYRVLSLLAILGCYSLLYLMVDKPLAYTIQHLGQTSGYHISVWIGQFTAPKYWLLAALALAMFTSVAKYRRAWQTWMLASYYFSATIFLSLTIGKLLKFSLARYRPVMLFEQQLYGFHFASSDWALNSTPSGHALCAFAAATVASLLYRRYAPWFYLIALVLTVGRVLSLAHYASDVLLGAYIGVLVAYWIYPYFRYYHTKLC